MGIGNVTGKSARFLRMKRQVKRQDEIYKSTNMDSIAVSLKDSHYIAIYVSTGMKAAMSHPNLLSRWS